MPISERGKVSHDDLAALFVGGLNVVLHPQVVGAHRDPAQGNALVLDLHVTADLEHFAGHFPGAPVLPGVVQIDWAVRYAREYLTLSGHFTEMKNIKFLALVLPDAKLQLSLKWDAGTKYLDFSFLTSQRKCSVGRIVFGGAE